MPCRHTLWIHIITRTHSIQFRFVFLHSLRCCWGWWCSCRSVFLSLNGNKILYYQLKHFDLMLQMSIGWNWKPTSSISCWHTLPIPIYAVTISVIHIAFSSGFPSLVQISQIVLQRKLLRVVQQMKVSISVIKWSLLATWTFQLNASDVNRECFRCQ